MDHIERRGAIFAMLGHCGSSSAHGTDIGYVVAAEELLSVLISIDCWLFFFSM